MKKIIILGDFNCAVGKMDMNVRNKTQRLYSALPLMRCQNSSWIMGLRIYGEGRTQIPLSSPTTIDSLAQDPMPRIPRLTK